MPLVSRTGRVQSWIDNPESRLPVSCTVFVVEDSMEGPNGIEASWKFASHALRNGAGCAIHLSKLRPKGTESKKGNRYACCVRSSLIWKNLLNSK